MRRTLILFKPDAVQRHLCGRLLQRLEEKGLVVIGAKVMLLGEQLARQHYAQHADKPFFDRLIRYIISGPVWALAVAGPDAVTVVRRMVGSTDPLEAQPGTIRGDYGLHKGRNLVHASDSQQAAEREISAFFRPEELVPENLFERRFVLEE